MISIPSKDGTVMYIDPLQPLKIIRVRKTKCSHFYHSISKKGKKLHGFRRITKAKLSNVGIDW